MTGDDVSVSPATFFFDLVWPYSYLASGRIGGLFDDAGLKQPVCAEIKGGIRPLGPKAQLCAPTASLQGVPTVAIGPDLFCADYGLEGNVAAAG